MTLKLSEVRARPHLRGAVTEVSLREPFWLVSSHLSDIGVQWLCFPILRFVELSFPSWDEADFLSDHLKFSVMLGVKMISFWSLKSSLLFINFITHPFQGFPVFFPPFPLNPAQTGLCPEPPGIVCWENSFHFHNSPWLSFPPWGQSFKMLAGDYLLTYDICMPTAQCLACWRFGPQHVNPTTAQWLHRSAISASAD